MELYVETPSGDTLLIEIDNVSGTIRIKFAGDSGYEINLTKESALDLADSILLTMTEE